MLAAAIITGVVYANKGKSEDKKDPPEIMDGESTLYNYAIAYPTMNEGDITYIDISSVNGGYGMSRPEDGDNFEFYSVDKDGNVKIYYPDIVFEDSTFSYDSLYATADGDGFGKVPKLTYLCLALRAPYFDERIILSDNAEEKEKQLKAYGFEKDKTTTIFFTYEVKKLDEDGNPVKDEDGNPVTETKSHTLTIGRKDITGKGYYYMVDDREYVYASSSDSFDHALAGLESLIKSTLVSAGVSSDNGFGPYLTQGYHQWKTTQYKGESDPVPEGSEVIVFADKLTVSTGDEKEKPEADGYIHTGYKVTNINLSENKKNAAYDAMRDAFKNKTNGIYKDASGEGTIVFSIVQNASSNRLVEFSDSESIKYTYKIERIDSVFTSEGEKFDTGYAVGANDKIKVMYSVTVGEKTYRTASVLDLSSLDRLNVNQSVKNTLSAASVGDSFTDLSFDVSYTAENAASRSGKYKIVEILAIRDKSGKEINKVTSESTVSYRYVFEVDGVNVYEKVFPLDLSQATGETDEKIKKSLLSQSVASNLNIIVDEYTAYFEVMNEFETYKISRIDYSVTNELVSSFKFQNASERDPYYGESLYENLLTNEYSLYGLNYDVCQGVVKFLGGIDEDGESVTAVGLSGLETVAIGLTPEVMDKYKLYAHKISFTLPRGIKSYVAEGDDDDDEKLSDYTFYDQITFTLYISDIDPLDGMRYVGSDMYDIVTKINGDDFFFLEQDFAEFWARRNIILVDVKNIADISVEFGYDDIKGKYNFELISQKVTNGQNVSTITTVKVTPEGDCTPTEITKFIEEKGYTYVSMSEFFNELYKDDPELNEYKPESLGSTYFKETLLLLYSSQYEGVLTEADKDKATELNKRLLRIELNLTKGSAYTYVYEFYAVDATKVAISIHKENSSGEVVMGPAMDFYISTFAFKKIAKNGFYDLLNGVKIDPEIGYPDETKK